MAPAKSETSKHTVAPSSPDLGWITHWAFVLCLVLVMARLTMTQTLRDPTDVVPATPGSVSVLAPRGVGPAAGLGLDLLCCVPAILVLVRRLTDRTYIIRTNWCVGVMAGLGAWMMASQYWASDRFAAAVGAADFIAALAMMWAASQLVRSWLRLRIVGGVVVALLLVYLVAAVNYRYFEMAQVRQNWQQNREQILREHGWQNDPFHAQQFEKKVLGGEMVLFTASPNSLAAALVLMAAVVLGLAIQRRADRDPIAWATGAALLAALAVVVLSWTHTRTAAGTMALAVVILATLRWWRPCLARHATAGYVVGAVILLAGMGAAVGYGLKHNGLAEKSLTFRWYYWTGAARMVRSHPLLGVGWSNFGQHYPAVRVATAPEEVQDPHNLLVRFAAELGIVGLVLAGAWLAKLAWDVTRPVLPAAAPSREAGPRAATLLVILAVGATLLNALVAIDFSQSGDYIVFEGFKRVVMAVLLVVGLGLATVRSLHDDTIDDRPAPWLLYAMLAGAGVFVLHNLLDFAMFETAPLFLFALVAGSAWGVRQPSRAGQRRRTPVAAACMAVAAIALLVLAGRLWVPTLLAESLAAAGDADLAAGRPDRAMQAYSDARDQQPLNADYAYRAARAGVYSQASPAMVQSLIRVAIDTDAMCVQYHLFQGELEANIPSPDVTRVKASYDRALALNPCEARLHLQYARVLAKLGDREGSRREIARAFYWDDQLPLGEAKRLSEEEKHAATQPSTAP